MANSVTIRELVKATTFKVIVGEEFLNKEVTSTEIHRPGVELTWYFNFYPSWRVQLMGQTEGWANFLACLKAYLEYGINLRKGAFDFMKP